MSVTFLGGLRAIYLIAGRSSANTHRRARSEGTTLVAELLEEAAPSAPDRPVADEPAGAAPARSRRGVSLAYALGLGVQVVLWSLVFLALAMAIATGGHLTEFRYVGF